MTFSVTAPPLLPEELELPDELPEPDEDELELLLLLLVLLVLVLVLEELEPLALDEDELELLLLVLEVLELPDEPDELLELDEDELELPETPGPPSTSAGSPLLLSQAAKEAIRMPPSAMRGSIRADMIRRFT